MSHQRYPSYDPVKEPHSISLKVLRLSRPSLVTQHPLTPPLTPLSPSSSSSAVQAPISASLAYPPASTAESTDYNTSPFVLSPILNLPVSFGSAYVGETFSCTLCANNDLPPTGPSQGGNDDQQQPKEKQVQIRDVRIEAEMKSPTTGNKQKLDLMPLTDHDGGATGGNGEEQGLDSYAGGRQGVDLPSGGTLQKIVNYDLKEEGNLVLAVTVSYYEATETSGRTRTFRKLYQFICKSSLIVRTKVALLDDGVGGGDPNSAAAAGSQSKGDSTRQEPQKKRGRKRRKWSLEAQLENCSEEIMQLDKVALEVETGLTYVDCNWEATGSEKPILHPEEVEQVCFVVQEEGGIGGGTANDDDDDDDMSEAAKSRMVKPGPDGRIVLGVLGIGWRGQMGSRGFLSTGKLSAKAV